MQGALPRKTKQEGEDRQKSAIFSERFFLNGLKWRFIISQDAQSFFFFISFTYFQNEKNNIKC